jgi:hypothetical protein
MNESTELKGRYSDFIGEYSCAYSTEYCNEIIRCFDYYQDINAVYCEDNQFQNKNAGRFDWAIDLVDMGPSLDGPVSKQMNDVLFECLEEYTTVFGHLSTVPFYSLAQKIQKTPAGGGYHVWHDENTTRIDSSRSLVWMIYLNDDYEGGETEFLYYKKRMNAERGKLLIWPAGMTHCHRGGMVLKGNKYVATGWFYLTGGITYAREE